MSVIIYDYSDFDYYCHCYSTCDVEGKDEKMVLKAFEHSSQIEIMMKSI